MHQIGASQPRAQAKFFLLMTELHYRFLQGLERLHIGRTTLASPTGPRDDNLATSLQPSLAPGTADAQAPFEGQGRGFVHGHGKGHGIVGPTMQWLRAAVSQGSQGLVDAIRGLRNALLSTAASVQYESANEPGKQLGVVDMPYEPFTEKQQRQSRMDGGEDDDGSLREFVPIGPPVVQPHIERERNKAAAENRMPCVGNDAYVRSEITGAFQSIFPWYRQRFSFGRLGGGASRPADVSEEAPHEYRRDAHLFQLAEDGRIVGVRNPDGSVATQNDLETDARQWATHFSYDFRNLHSSNHEHDCKATCVKYVKKKLEAKESLRSNKCSSCRFWFFRIKQVKTKEGVKRLRRRGKPLVAIPYIEESADRNDEYRCKVAREQPFRSASNDVGQVSNRCNLDYQFLPCAPKDIAPEETAGGASQLAAAAVASDSTVSGASRPAEDHKWLYGTGHKALSRKLCGTFVESFAAAFQKQYAMDFYITKYQGKQMEALTPLFKTMQSGVHRLEEQEREEERLAQTTAEEPADGVQQNQPTNNRKTNEALARRARRLTVRLAAMANRCYWLSATEVAVHILTGGDCLQTHNHQRLFTRQLQWALQECKRELNGEGETAEAPSGQQNIEAVTIRLTATAPQPSAVVQPGAVDSVSAPQPGAVATVSALQPGAVDAVSAPQLGAVDTVSALQPGAVDAVSAPQPGAGDGAHDAIEDLDADAGDAEDAAPDNDFDADNAEREDAEAPAVEVLSMTTATSSTNAADDYAHRGSDLLAMPMYVYRMYVRRELRGNRRAAPGGTLFEFEPHYPLARGYVQKMRVDRMNVPTIDGFQCPTWRQDPELNSLFKAMLFTPWVCRDPMTCGCVSRYAHLLSNGSPGGSAQSPDATRRKFTFERAWRLRCSEIHVLAQRAEARGDASQKLLVLADTTLLSNLKEPKEALDRGLRLRRKVMALSSTWRTMPSQALRSLLSYAGRMCPWHAEQCTLAEYCAYVARDTLAHMELAAEARVKPLAKKTQTPTWTMTQTATTKVTATVAKDIWSSKMLAEAAMQTTLSTTPRMFP